MSKIILRGVCHGSNFKLGLNLSNLYSVKRNIGNLKLFSVRNTSLQQYSYHHQSNQKKHLPNLIYIQNPITWLINKLDFFMLRKAWDPDFDEKEFKRGVKQAMSVICTLLSHNLWSQLRGLVANQALTTLQRDVEFKWTKEKRKNLAIHPSDIQLVLPRKVHFLKIADQRFAYVDMICVAVKFREDPLPDSKIVIIEMLARFHRNYTVGQIPEWTVTALRVLSQNVKSLGRVDQKGY